MSTDAVGMMTGAVLVDDRNEQAQRAVKAFRALQPTLTAYAKMLTKRNDVRVEMAARDNGSTDGTRIFYRPPMALGDKTPHVRKLCDKRDDKIQLYCDACRRREETLVVIYHEIAHICFDSFAKTTNLDKRKLIEEAVKTYAGKYAASVAARIEAAPSYVKNSYIGMAGLVNQFLPFIVNCLEDARVNRELFYTRKGTKKMFDALANRVFDDGFEAVDADGSAITIHWSERPLNLQVMIGLFCKASGYDYKNWFVEPVVKALDDEQLTDLIRRMDTIRSASGVYHLSFGVLTRLRELGFCKLDTDPTEDEEEEEQEEEEPESPAPQEENQDDSEPTSDGDQSGESDESHEDSSADDSDEPVADNQESDGAGSDDDADLVPESELDTDPESEPEDDSTGSSHDPEDSSETGDQQSDDSGGGSTDDPEEAEEGEEDQGPDDADSEGIGAVGDDDSEDDSSPGEGDDSEDDSLPGEASSAADDTGAEEEELGGPNDGEFRDGSSEGSSPERPDNTDGDESELRGEDGTDSSPERGSGDLEGEALDDDESTDTDDTDSQAGGSSSNSGGGEGSVGAESDETPDDDRGEGSEGTPEGDPAELGATDTEGDEPGQRESEVDSPEPASDPGSEPAEGEVIDTGADRGLGGTQVIESDAELPEMGDASDVEEGLKKWGAHDDPPKTAEEIQVERDDQKAIDRAIIQGMYFETPSSEVTGVIERRFGDAETGGAWDHGIFTASGYSLKSLGIEGDFIPPETILGPALLHMRTAFADNFRGKDQRNLKAGRINNKSLGRRAPFNDPRLMKKRRQPGRKKYFVILGVDVSGSTVGVNIALEKRAVTAQAELCARMGIDFAIYAHTGSYSTGRRGSSLNLDIYHIKDREEPWDTGTRERLHQIGPDSCNLDGHTLEFYRKRLDESDATDKIIMYYTDGKMPAENHDEELEILTRELRICKQKRYAVMGVGIRTDSPVRHGLDTVQVDDDEDIPRVVKHLEKRLLADLGR